MNIVLIQAGVTGFESPATEYTELPLSIDELIIGQKRHAVFLGRASGESMHPLIQSGDILVCDRSLDAQNGDIVVAVLDGELVCKYYDIKGQQLLSENPQFKPVKLSEVNDFVVEAVVRHAIRSFKTNKGLDQCMV
jgi:DNA polymerase V